MRVLAAIAIACLALPAAAQDARKNDPVRQECREKARQAIKPIRGRIVDRDHMRETRREYIRDCVARAKQRG